MDCQIERDLEGLSVPRPLQGPFQHERGFMWSASADGFGVSDSSEAGHASNVQLLEDGVPLSPAHTTGEFITVTGLGGYSHWGDRLYFSASDSSDPSCNGRRYSVRTHKQPLILTFGSCHLHFVTGRLQTSSFAKIFWPIGQTHSTSEMLQFVKYCTGAKHIDKAIQPFFISDLENQPLVGTGRIFDADVLFLEICNPFDFEFDGVSLNRTELANRLVAPIRELGGPDLEEAVNNWYNQGLMEQNAEATKLYADMVLERIPANTTERQLYRELIANIRPRRIPFEEMESHLREIRDILKIPMRIAIHTRRYMPDGRPLSWPADLARQTKALADALGVPLIRPSDFVEELGADVALLPNLSYYTPEMEVRYGKAVIDLCRDLETLG